MSGQHKFTCPAGCCICATKNSTSQFRPWYENCEEETLLRIFQLKTLDNRRGLMCNPCVLYIKRAKNALANGGPLIDHTKRLNCKLKGKPTEDPGEQFYAPSSAMRAGADGKSLQKWTGWHVKNMRFYPRYVIGNGKGYYKLASKGQLVPAGEYQNPEDFLEDEDDAERDLPWYRPITLKEGVKTLRQQQKERDEVERRENKRLFGEVSDKSHPQARKERNGTRSYPTRSRRRRNQEDAGVFAEADDGFADEEDDEEANAAAEAEDAENTDSSDEVAENSSYSTISEMSSSQGSRKRRSSPGDDQPIMPIKKRRYLVEDQPSTSGERGKVVPRRTCIANRRFPRQPVKNRRLRKCTFFDCTYFQKFPMCCFDAFAAHGPIVSLRIRDPERFRKCPLARRQMEKYRKQRMQEQAMVPPASDVEMMAASAVASMAGIALGASCESFATALGEPIPRPRCISESDNSQDQASYPSTSTAVSREGSNPRLTPSPQSSGDDDRGNIPCTPILEQALTSPMFNFKPEALSFQRQGKQ